MAKFCTNCGNEVDENADVCLKCGKQLTKTTTNTNEVVIPEEYKPISMWGYFGYQILFSLPIVGFILLLVFSFGGTKNINLKNFARSYFCFFIIIVIIVIIVISVGSIAIGTSSYY